MAELAAAVEEETAVSDRRRTAARAAFTWRTIDAELAELLHDSALDAGAAVRSGSDGPRMLSFRRAAVTLEVEIDGDAVLGEVIDESEGDAPATVTLQRPDTEDRSVEADASGFFRFDGVGPGSVRFVVTRAGLVADHPLGDDLTTQRRTSERTEVLCTPPALASLHARGGGPRAGRTPSADQSVLPSHSSAPRWRRSRSGSRTTCRSTAPGRLKFRVPGPVFAGSWQT